MAKRLFVTPILNTMGPVKDPMHSDLLNTWEQVDKATEKYFNKKFRRCLLDSRGREVVVSWFPVSWSGFASNPVHRDFGWFTIFDHLVQTWGEKISECGDGVYWMYNHPDKSGIGNVWGLDWLHNCHYFEILNRMVLERGYFPGVVEVPTAETHSVNFVENYFPFELSNRYSPKINWENIEADGRKTKEVLQWASAPKNWRPYQPAHSNHQENGAMRHHIFRLLDIKSRIMTFPEEEILDAFESCRQGYDVVIAGYEHDFRDRSEAVQELFLEPISRIAKKYPDVEVINTNFQSAAIDCLNLEKTTKLIAFKVSIQSDHVCISSDAEIFGPTPYIAIKDKDSGNIFHINPTPNGYLSWAIQRGVLPLDFELGVAAFSNSGVQSVNRFDVKGESVTLLSGGLDRRITL